MCGLKHLSLVKYCSKPWLINLIFSFPFYIFFNSPIRVPAPRFPSALCGHGFIRRHFRRDLLNHR